MGTLFDQPNRDLRRLQYESDLEAFLKEYIALSKKYEIPLSEIISLANVMELKRRNDLYVDNGNIFDEQMAGIGHILNQQHMEF